MAIIPAYLVLPQNVFTTFKEQRNHLIKSKLDSGLIIQDISFDRFRPRDIAIMIGVPTVGGSVSLTYHLCSLNEKVQAFYLKILKINIPESAPGYGAKIRLHHFALWDNIAKISTISEDYVITSVWPVIVKYRCIDNSLYQMFEVSLPDRSKIL